TEGFLALVQFGEQGFDLFDDAALLPWRRQRNRQLQNRLPREFDLICRARLNILDLVLDSGRHDEEVQILRLQQAVVGSHDRNVAIYNGLRKFSPVKTRATDGACASRVPKNIVHSKKTYCFCAALLVGVDVLNMLRI